MRKLLLVFALLAVPFALFIGCNMRSNPTAAPAFKAADVTPGATASNCIIYSDNFSANTLGNYNYFCTFIQGAGTAATEGYTITGGTLEDTHPGGLAVLNATSFNTATTSYTVEADFELNTTQNNLGIFGLAFEAGSNHSFYSFQWSFDGSASGGTPDWELEKNNGTPNTGASYLASVTTPAYTLGSTVHMKLVVNGNNFQGYVNLNDGAGDRLIFNVTDTDSPYTGGSVGFRTYGIKGPMVVQIGHFTVSSCSATPTPIPTLNCAGLSGGSDSICPESFLSWSTLAPMPTAREELACGVVNGILYVVGGWNNGTLNTVEAYDPITNSWSTKAPMPTARLDLAVGVVNGVLYAVGGNDGGNDNAVEAYNPATNSWSTKAPMPTGRFALSVGVVNGILYAVGGDGNASRLNTVEAYDPTTNSWSTKAPMPTAREGMAAGVLNGIIYVVGGEVSTGDVGTLEAYNPCTNSWTTGLPGSPSVQAYSAGGVMNGQFYVVEGLGPDVGTVASYNPSTNSWTSQAIDPTLRQFDAGSVINNVLYLVGGFVPNPFHGVAAPNEGAALVCGLSPTPTMPPASHTPAYTFTLTPTLSPTFTPTHIPNLTPQPPTPTATCVIYSDNFSANTLGNYTFFGGLTIPEAGTAADAGYTITGGTLEEIHGSGLAVLNSSFFNPGLSQYTIQADFEVDVPGSFGLIFDTQSEGFRHRFGWNGSGWVLDDNDTLPGDVNTLGTAAAPVYTPGVVAHLKVIVDDGNIQCYANLNDGAGDQLIFNLPGVGPLSGGSVGIIASASGGGSMAVKISNFTVSSCQTPPPTPTYASTCVSSIYSDNFTTLSLGNYTSWNIPLDVSQQPSTAGYFILNGSLWNNGAEAGVSGDLVLNNALLVSTTSYTLQADFEMDSDPGNQGLFGLLLGASRAGYTTFQWNDAGTASGGSPDWELETYNPFEGFPVGGFHPFYLGHATAPAYTLGTVAHLKVVVTGNNYHCYVNYNDGAGDRLIFNVTDTEPLTNAAGFNAGLSSTHPMVKINNFVVNGCP